VEPLHGWRSNREQKSVIDGDDFDQRAPLCQVTPQSHSVAEFEVTGCVRNGLRFVVDLPTGSERKERVVQWVPGLVLHLPWLVTVVTGWTIGLTELDRSAHECELVDPIA
jgi:hypothetical protein